jgi:protein transport protein SEC23
MNLDATIYVVTSKEIKICGALGPCISCHVKNNLVSEKEIGKGGTHSGKQVQSHPKHVLHFLFSEWP